MNQIIMIFMIFNTAMFTKTTHPMSMGLILLVQTLLTCIFTGVSTKSFWFSYILFLIFIGGMLVLFIYMASLAPNEKFSMDMKMLIKLIIVTFLLIMMMNLDNYIINTQNMNYEQETYCLINNLLKENFLSSSKMYDLPNNFIVIFMINYLLLNLIIIVKITNIYQGPLRSKIN